MRIHIAMLPPGMQRANRIPETGLYNE